MLGITLAGGIYLGYKYYREGRCNGVYFYPISWLVKRVTAFDERGVLWFLPKQFSLLPLSRDPNPRIPVDSLDEQLR